MNKAKNHLSAPLAAAPPHSRTYSLLGGFYRSRWTMILMGVLLIVVAACGGGDSPAPKGDAAEEQATVQAEAPSGDAAKPTPAPGTSGMSLDEYMAVMCEEEEFLGTTYREFSAYMEPIIAEAEAINPPPEVAEYHNQGVALVRDLKAAIDGYGGSKDDVITPEGFESIVFSQAASGGLEAIAEAGSAMAPKVRERMIAGGCLDIDENLAEGEAEAPTADDQAAGQASTSPFGGIEWCESNLGENRAVLVALYNATGGPNWTDNENWLTDAPLSEWAGVGSSAEWSEDRLMADCVLTLNLSANQLTGEIPAELGELSELTGLFLGENQLTGEIPAELGELSEMISLDLAGNQLTGEIPAELGELSEMFQLDLSDNQLTGEIPAELGKMTYLETLDLGGNQLIGEIPAELGELKNLGKL